MNNTHPPQAHDAMQELIDLLTIAQGNPGGPDAFEEFCKLGLPVIVCDVNAGATGRAGNGVAAFKVNEALMRHMSTFLA